MTIDIQKQKKRLLEEKNKIEQELQSLAIKDNRGLWQAKQTETNEPGADREEAAEAVTEFEENSAFVTDLNNQLIDVTEALLNIEGGNYGICAVCNEQIEEGRLEANPSAKTCKKHM